MEILTTVAKPIVFIAVVIVMIYIGSAFLEAVLTAHERGLSVKEALARRFFNRAKR
ncbi:MAG TPA: hypothetical protein VGA53_04455 [Candidatus Paceibacterota bacterium]